MCIIYLLYMLEVLNVCPRSQYSDWDFHNIYCVCGRIKKVLEIDLS